ncbi:putative lovastatin nonaketide synthase protein [Rosellinia necatrix]|uniref:Putative lovastatin nonaketide synthase protein n=1 Tax=Rosellinia necatrix TaxID=77044 RepID=A0A1W2TXC1_ROSNE|nr:putative lovastatin nonaketide synthase protein [Rosellinia necatrix]
MAPQKQPEPIAIVGSACRFPGGANSPSSLWKLLEAPRDLCQDIPKDRFDTTRFYHPDGSHHGTTNVRQSYFLEEDVRVFDAAFFNLSPNEADSIDPQQRLLLETVYEAMERGGHTLEGLRGSDTAVYTGTMSVDYADTGIRDLDTIPTYFATGTNRAIISNRVSYFFDWHGPSMTIDTACSSSLIAVHQGVTALRTGESRVAVACGTQVILNPETFIVESKLSMLSPTGRSRMWDADADGYARGEGVAAVVLKKLSDAIADGDHIETIIRETGTNQDGHTSGITVPSTEAQAALIRQTYARAGLDPENNPLDRPQFFEAHGTGTKAGDPREAAAIYQSFGRHFAGGDTPLYVGSVKTVIGHLEGTAGLAGLLKGSASIQQGFIAPNLLFNRLNPTIEPFYKGLQVATHLTAWPELPEGVPRRVSVNSFGFGGSNAHAILEQYMGESAEMNADESADSKPFTPFVFSAASEAALVGQLQAFSHHLKTRNDINLSDLAWTLQKRRSQFAIKASFSAATIEQLVSKIDAKLSLLEEKPGSTIGMKASSKPSSTPPRILGVFTGQGAQWAAMGAQLIRSSSFVRNRVQELEDFLNTVPSAHRPTWSLQEEMLASSDTSRIGEAALSQPLCTAIQIILVDLLKTAGITFSAVVGHSSGEIAAAYAAGFLSDRDAVRVAYYRGLYARLAGNSNSSQKGAMLAVGTSWEDAQELISLRAFKGRLAIAAHNSSASVTLSGDADAVVHAKKIFDEEKKFARLLKVDTAYHSHHMLPCGDPYVEALGQCGVEVTQGDTNCAWFSSVVPSEKPMNGISELAGSYWRDNMTNAVLFADAVKNAVASDETITLAIEVGPHPALKGPAAQNISDVRPNPLPYTGVLSRGQDDVEAFSVALGFVWTQLGAQAVNFQSYQEAVAGVSRRPQLVIDLPSYQWNHSRSYWSESRKSRKMRATSTPGHELLGHKSTDSNARDLRWSNVLKASEISWLNGHQLQGQTVFPAAGYIAMALEASRSLAADKPVELFELNDLTLPKAIAFEDGDISGVETLVTLTAVRNHKDRTTTADFSCYALQVVSTGSKSELELVASGTVKIVFGAPRLDALAHAPVEDYNMYDVDIDAFYTSLSKLGYGYNGPFRTLSSARRRLGYLVGEIDSYAYPDPDSYVYLVHPSTLDVAFQASILAYSAPGDDHLWSLHVPTAIKSIRINPEVCAMQPTSGSRVPVSSVLSNAAESFSGSIDMFSEDGQYGMIQVENLVIKPFAPATAADDRVMFTHTKFDVGAPDGAAITKGIHPSPREIELGVIGERLCYYYVRQWDSELTDDDWNKSQPHFLHLRNWVNHMLSTASSGKHGTVRKEWAQDTRDDSDALIKAYPDDTDIRMIAAVGENIPASVRGETTILEHMMRDNLLDNYYKYCLGAEVYNGFLADMVKQITHRYPHAKILEIGAGTGGATKSILEAIGHRMSSYTYTDISSGFFGHAEELFKEYVDKMTFKLLDVEKAPSAQGYEPHSYDIVIASNVLHATPSLHTTLVNTRQLLKPGGYLLLLELTNPEPLRSCLIFGSLPGWWFGVDDGRKLAPIVAPKKWNTELRQAGFGGIDAITPEIHKVSWPASIIASQAVDDRVQFLRRPLFSQSSSKPVYIDSLVILGNGTLETSRISEELSEHLRPFCGEVTVLESLPTEAEASALPPMSTFINLADLDTPIFKDITEEKMEGIKRISDQAKHILWITQGALVDQPYHMASIAFTRVLRVEANHVSLNNLDISNLDQDNVSKLIAEHLLQLYALDEWELGQGEQQQLLWSKEPEAFLEGSKLKVPRLVNNVDQNSRMNSARRVVTKQVSASQTNIALLPPSANAPASLVDIGPVSTSRPEKEAPLRISSSSLMAFHIVDDAFLFLGVSNNNVLVSTTNTSERIPVASVVSPTAAQSTDALLVAVASELLAASLVQNISSGSSIVVHASGKDRFLAAALSRRAAAKEICITFTYDTDTIDQARDLPWTKLSARASQHVIRKFLYRVAPSHFIDLTSALHLSDATCALSTRIAQALPLGCKTVDASVLLQSQPSLRSSYDLEGLKSRLQDVVSSAILPSHDQVQDLVVQLGQTYDPSTSYYTTSAIHWPSDASLKALVRPLDSRRLFSKDKTYVLAGVSGRLGQSLCEFMVSNGAGCVVITSRRPAIDQRWLNSFQGTDAIVKVLPMDVTDKQSVDRAVKDIRANCPPVAGVAHGAMVLHDSLFSRMTATKMQEILAPKVDGANNLEAAFHDDDLDFFVMFSSVSSVVGNAGQSLYAAGNGYLNGLVRQRRSRGLAASTFDIGRVVGVGYIETVGQHVRDQLIGLGIQPISEVVLRQSFAETIQAGYPDPRDKGGLADAIVTMGIRNFHEDEDVKGPWFTNPLFSHCVVKQTTVEADSGDQGKKAMLPVSQQLARAATKDQALEILINCFSAKLRIIIQLGDQAIDQDAPLVDLGIDSLVAVEVRSWFLKELKVDIPVLKVVGGASPADLCQSALEKLPEELLGSIGQQNTAPPKPVEKKKPTFKLPVNLPAELPAGEQARDSETSSTTGDVSSGQQDASTSPSSAPSITSGGHTPDSKKANTTPTSYFPVQPASTSAPVVKRPARRFVKSVPMSLGQSRFWFLQQLLENQRTHNVAYYYHITGNLHVSDLEKATRIVASRHESLRTCFVADEADAAQANQKVLATSPVRFECKKIDTVDDVTSEYGKLRTEDLDLASGELIRLVLLTLSPSSHYLLMYHHHIIMDGVSLQVFISDLEKAYNGQSLGPAPRQYPDFAAAQREAYEKGEMSTELKYWRGVFPDGEQPPVLPLLPMARTTSRVPMKKFDTHQVEFRLGTELAARVRSVSKANRCTPFHFYLAAFKAMLFSFTDAQDLTIGIADAARNDSNVMGSIGFFLNLLPLRFRRQSDQSFSEAILEARNTSYAALATSRLPFDVLLSELNVTRDSSYSPFFQAFLDYRQGAQEKHPFGNCEFEMKEVNTGKTGYDITLDITDLPTDAAIFLRAQKSIYDLAAAKLLSEIFAHFVDVLTADPSTSLDVIPRFSEKQLTQAVQIGRGPKLASEWPDTLPHRIDQVALRNADKVALMDGTGKALTYSDMIGRIEAIAESLQNAGVDSGSRVLVFQQATADWPCSMLAIMRVGAVYVPLDLRNPIPRLAAAAVDCEPKAILVDATTLADAPQLGAGNASIIDVSSLEDKSSTTIANLARGDTPAAILYTSGSTGTPKGIVVTHSGLRNEIEGYTTMWKLGAERVLQQSAFTFNHSSDQMYTGLVNGGMVYVVPWDKRGNPIEITQIIQQHSITYTKATPSEYLLWMQYGGDSLRQASQWRFAFGGGENLTTTVTQEFANLGLQQLRVFNSYGPTEISISSTKMEISYRDTKALEAVGRIPCGYSLPNYHAYIVDEQLNPLPAGMPGELCIGGAGVSRGYFKNEELTKQHFVQNPFATPEDIASGWTGLYRTGDICHLTEGGEMVFRNRVAGDTQVKIRGLRIELSDIESNIVSASAGALNEAVVTLREGDQEFLVAHVVFAPNHNVTDEDAFLERLLRNLQVPQYMVPVVAIPLDKLPLTNHAKVDRKVIQKMALPRKVSDTPPDLELGETALQLKALWQGVLGKSIAALGFEISASTNFFLVGGNSLLMVRLQQQIRRAFRVAVPLVELLGAGTLAQMARKVEEGAVVEPTDWERETAPPAIPDFLRDVAPTAIKRRGKSVLVTGGTGFLAKYVLPRLAADPDVAAVHCVAVREKPGRTPSPYAKVRYHAGDLSRPLLGLSEAAFAGLAAEVDAVLHMGGARSFWDNYHVLRPSNVHPTRELVRLAAPRRVPIHYISTGGVLPRGMAANAASAAAYPPPADGSNGYVATRWASERILERAQAGLGIPAAVHRFHPATATAGARAAPRRALDEFARCVRATGLVPDAGGWDGRLDMIPADEVARSLCAAVLGGDGEGDTVVAVTTTMTTTTTGTRFFRYESAITVTMAELMARLGEQDTGHCTTHQQQQQQVPIVKWIGRIKAQGFDYFLASHEATIAAADQGSAAGPVDTVLESRR